MLYVSIAFVETDVLTVSYLLSNACVAIDRILSSPVSVKITYSCTFTILMVQDIGLVCWLRDMWDAGCWCWDHVIMLVVACCEGGLLSLHKQVCIIMAKLCHTYTCTKHAAINYYSYSLFIQAVRVAHNIIYNIIILLELLPGLSHCWYVQPGTYGVAAKEGVIPHTANVKYQRCHVSDVQDASL